jgi:nitroreductase
VGNAAAGPFGNGKFGNRAWKAMLAPSNPIGQPRRVIAHQPGDAMLDEIRSTDLFEIIRTTRSMRRLKPDPVPGELIRKILEAGVCAPSGGNMQRWRFLVVRDPRIKETVGAFYKRAWDEQVAPRYRAGEPAPNTFEFALVLGGTVSAGAYTAGVVDFLIEALDCWTGLRDKNDASAPQHKVLLKVITGTSGGGVNAAIAARALAYDFPHVVRSTPHPERDTGNPFYETWIKRLTLSGFLGTTDIDQGTLVSLLDGKPIDDGAAYLAEFARGDPIERNYLGDPLRVILTLTNLRGIP